MVKVLHLSYHVPYGILLLIYELKSGLFQGKQVIIYGLPAVVEVYVAIGTGFLHLFGERGGVRFIDPLAVIERDDLMGIIFQLIQNVLTLRCPQCRKNLIPCRIRPCYAHIVQNRSFK